MVTVIISNRLSVPDRNSYFQNLWTEYWSGVCTGIGTDLAIVAATGVELRAHRAILLPLSPALTQLLQSAEICECEGNVPTLHLPDRSPDDIRLLLQLVYTGSCVISDRSMYDDLFSLMSDMGFTYVTQATQNCDIESQERGADQMLNNNNCVYDNGTVEEVKIKTEYGNQDKDSEPAENFKCVNCNMEFLPNKPVSYVIHERACKGGMSSKYEEPELFSDTQMDVVQEEPPKDTLIPRNISNDMTDKILQQNMIEYKTNAENVFNVDENFSSLFTCYICDKELDRLGASVYLHYSTFHFSEELLTDFSNRVVDDQCVDCGTRLESLQTPHWFLVHMGVKHKRVEKYLPAKLHIGSNLDDGNGCSISRDNSSCGGDSLVEKEMEVNANEGSDIKNQIEYIKTLKEKELSQTRNETAGQNISEDIAFKGDVTNGSQIEDVNPEISKSKKDCSGTKRKALKKSNSNFKKLKGIEKSKQLGLKIKTGTICADGENFTLKENKKVKQEKCVDQKENLYSESKKCSICFKEFSKNLQLRSHYSRLHFNKELVVEMTPLFEKSHGTCLKDGCFKSFKSIKSFINHMGASHREVDKYVGAFKAQGVNKKSSCRAKYKNCPRCDKKTRAYNTVNHMVTHYYNELTELLRHNDKKHATPLICSHCEKQFGDLNDLIHHAVESHNVLGFVCTDEELKFATTEENPVNTSAELYKTKKLGLAKKKVSSQRKKFSVANQTPIITRSNQNKCKICRKQQNNFAGLLQHVSCHFSKELSKEFSEVLSHPGPQITCPKCSKDITKKSFVKHIGALHKEVVKYAPWIKCNQSQNKQKSEVKATGLPKSAGESLVKKVAPVYEFTDDVTSQDSKVPQYKSGDLVFVQLSELPPWPAKVVSNTWLGVDVSLFGLNNVGTVKNNKIWPYNDQNVKNFSAGEMKKKKLASLFEKGLKEIESNAKHRSKEIESNAKNDSVSQIFTATKTKRKSSKHAARCLTFPSTKTSVIEQMKDTVEKTGEQMKDTVEKKGDDGSQDSRSDSTMDQIRYSCPFDGCEFQTDWEGMKSGPAARHGMECHNTQPWEMKKHGLKFKKVSIENPVEALASQGMEDAEIAQIQSFTESAEAINPQKNDSKTQSTSVIDQTSNRVGQIEKERVCENEEGDHFKPSPDTANPDKMCMEGVVPLDDSPICSPSTSSVLVSTRASPEY